MNHKKTILVVDDTLLNIDILKAILSPFYKVKVATNGKVALKIVELQAPDLILLDIMMPDMDGHEVCRRLKSDKQSANIPVIFVTAMADEDDEQKGFDLGAVDYITKPIKPAIVLARVKAQLALANQKEACENEVARKVKQLEKSHNDAINMLAIAGHYNDTDTGVHIWRMADYSGALAKAAQWPVEKTELLRQAAPMHDLGKIGIPDSILKAPRKLTDDEWVIMRTHSEVGYGILKISEDPVFKLAAEVSLFHHEKWDGSGYPHGLKAKEIPESARIVAIADVFDALTMKRPYKEAWSIKEACDTLKKDSGIHFDKELVELFISIKDEILKIKAYWDNKETLL